MKSYTIILISLLIAVAHGMINSEQSENQPYYAYVTFANLQTSFYGGGTLISFSHVLTCAANIRTFTMWRVGVGSNARTMHRTLTTNRAVIHPDYFEDIPNNVRVNDVGIIITLAPIERNSNIRPLMMAPFGIEDMTNVQGMILGFAGSTTSGNEGLENMQAGYVRIMSQLECSQAYPNAADRIGVFCAQDRQRRSNFCLGDQGGAYAVISRGVEYLVGVASLPGCSNMASTYMMVSTFRDWIRNETSV